MSRAVLGSLGGPSWKAARRSGLRLGRCRKVDGTDRAPIPEPFGTVLNDQADRGDLDPAFSLLRPESRDNRCHGLVRGAVADGDVGNPARRIPIRDHPEDARIWSTQARRDDQSRRAMPDYQSGWGAGQRL